MLRHSFAPLRFAFAFCPCSLVRFSVASHLFALPVQFFATLRHSIATPRLAPPMQKAPRLARPPHHSASRNYSIAPLRFASLCPRTSLPRLALPLPYQSTPNRVLPSHVPTTHCICCRIILLPASVRTSPCHTHRSRAMPRSHSVLRIQEWCAEVLRLFSPWEDR